MDDAVQFRVFLEDDSLRLSADRRLATHGRDLIRTVGDHLHQPRRSEVVEVGLASTGQERRRTDLGGEVPSRHTKEGLVGACLDAVVDDGAQAVEHPLVVPVHWFAGDDRRTRERQVRTQVGHLGQSTQRLLAVVRHVVAGLFGRHHHVQPIDDVVDQHQVGGCLLAELETRCVHLVLTGTSCRLECHQEDVLARLTAIDRVTPEHADELVAGSQTEQSRVFVVVCAEALGVLAWRHVTNLAIEVDDGRIPDDDLGVVAEHQLASQLTQIIVGDDVA